MPVTEPAQSVEDIEVRNAQLESLKDGTGGAFEVARAQHQPPDDFERARIQMRVTDSPGLDDAVDGVTLHMGKRSLTLSDSEVAWNKVT